MSGVYRGLAAQFREAAPLVLYTHCYAHVLNLVVKDLLQDINNKDGSTTRWTSSGPSAWQQC